MKRSYQLSDLSEIARWVLESLTSRVLLFNGPMGSGKTTLIKGFYQAGTDEKKNGKLALTEDFNLGFEGS